MQVRFQVCGGDFVIDIKGTFEGYDVECFEPGQAAQPDAVDSLNSKSTMRAHAAISVINDVGAH